MYASIYFENFFFDDLMMIMLHISLKIFVVIMEFLS